MVHDAMPKLINKVTEGHTVFFFAHFVQDDNGNFQSLYRDIIISVWEIFELDWYIYSSK